MADVVQQVYDAYEVIEKFSTTKDSQVWRPCVAPTVHPHTPAQSIHIPLLLHWVLHLCPLVQASELILIAVCWLHCGAHTEQNIIALLRFCLAHRFKDRAKSQRGF